MPYTPGRVGEAGQPSIETVLARQERALMAIDGVVGVAVGRTPAGDDAIVVYLRDAAARRHVPARLEGYPVETEVTGDIDAYRAPGSGR